MFGKRWNRQCIYVFLLGYFLAASACSDRDAAKGALPEPAVKEPAAAPPAAPPVVPPAAAPEPSREDVEAAARALVNAWVDAQNRGDFAGYIGFYDAVRFVGIKRTAAGGIRKLDFSGWKTDRERMFRKPMTVAAEDAQVRTWLEDGAGLPSGVATVRFVQRWKNAGYADHGPKLLRLRWDAGQPRIVYEDMLRSHSGWTAPSDDQKAELAQLSEAIQFGRTEVAALTRDKLIEVVNYGGCDAAMSAATELAARGDQAWLPRRPETDDAERIARVLCMLVNDADDERALQVFRRFLPSGGAVTVTINDCSGDDRYKKTHQITRAGVDRLPYDSYFGEMEPPWCTHDSGTGEWRCEGDGGGEGWRFTLQPAADGTLNIAAIENVHYLTCGC